MDGSNEASDARKSGRSSEEGGGGQPADTGVARQSDNQDGDEDGRPVSADIDKEKANSRGLLARAKGQRAYTIATGGSNELITAHRNDQITDAEAEEVAVALNAPGNTALQAAGLKALINGSKAIEAVNVMKAVMSVDQNADE